MNNIEWIATTQKSQWQSKDQLTVSAASNSKWDVEAYLDQPLQTIEGFGACLNELGWTSLNTLASADKEAIFRELFAPGVGANFSTCRMPVGANDFSLHWYSYDAVPNDFDLKHFSISRDLENLVPFIKSALQYQPALRIWASAWSPPVWMKYNNHYAGKPSEPDMPPNGLKPDQAAEEGRDQFIQEDRYFKAYATYFARFIQEYANLGNLLVFGNPDQSVVITMQNDLCQQLPVRVKVGDTVIASILEADSFNTFVVRR